MVHCICTKLKYYITRIIYTCNILTLPILYLIRQCWISYTFSISNTFTNLRISTLERDARKRRDERGGAHIQTQHCTNCYLLKLQSCANTARWEKNIKSASVWTGLELTSMNQRQVNKHDFVATRRFRIAICRCTINGENSCDRDRDYGDRVATNRRQLFRW